MKVRVEIPRYSVRCVRCSATAPIETVHTPGDKVDVDLACTCPSERPTLDLVFPFPAAHHLAYIPLSAR